LYPAGKTALVGVCGKTTAAIGDCRRASEHPERNTGDEKQSEEQSKLADAKAKHVYLLLGPGRHRTIVDRRAVALGWDGIFQAAASRNLNSE
jgi:hypothetical protein